MIMTKHILMFLMMGILASDVLCRTVDNKHKLKDGFKKSFLSGDSERDEDKDFVKKDVLSLETEDERETFKDEEDTDYVEEHITIDPDEPTPKKVLDKAAKGGPGGVHYAELEPFPMFSWHRKIWMTREIPYVIQHQGKTRPVILEAIRRLKGNMGTCLSFRTKQSSDKWWLEFYYGSGCFSGIGTKYWKTGATKISIGKNCEYNDIIQHEILHALGFQHEQSRIDRDKYVYINWQNIATGMESNFEKTDITEFHYYDTPYDFKSIMHYTKKAFSKKGKGDTIVRIKDKSATLSGDVMSPIDIKELKAMYHCQQKNDGWSSWISAQCMCTDDNEYCSQSKVRICIGTKACSGSRQQYGTQDVSKQCTLSDVCKDNPKYKDQCATWAHYGECDKKNAVWMKENCCLTCITIPCKDNTKYVNFCPGWQKSGECDRNPSWMSKNCCKSCKISS